MEGVGRNGVEENKYGEKDWQGLGARGQGQQTGTWLVRPDLLCPACLTYLQDPPTQGWTAIAKPSPIPPLDPALATNRILWPLMDPGLPDPSLDLVLCLHQASEPNSQGPTPSPTGLCLRASVSPQCLPPNIVTARPWTSAATAAPCPLLLPVSAAVLLLSVCSAPTVWRVPPRPAGPYSAGPSSVKLFLMVPEWVGCLLLLPCPHHLSSFSVPSVDCEPLKGRFRE